MSPIDLDKLKQLEDLRKEAASLKRDHNDLYNDNVKPLLTKK